jgi:hypothetical protein
MINAPLPDRLCPRAASLGLAPFYGDIHNHSDLSYGHGSFPDALTKAALQLDFVSVTGHAHWPDMPVDEPSVAHIVDFHVKGFAKLRAAWPGHYDVLRAADRPGAFTVFPGYEIHSCAHGDYTIVLADLADGPLELADDPAGLKAALDARYGDRAFAFPHHIGYRTGARGINWDSFDPELSPFVEMFSMHGCAEKSETERGYLHSMGPVDGHSTMAHGLAQGKHFGIVGNTDHHSGFPGSYGHGRMALYAPAHDRDGFWEAMRARRTNALTGDRIHLLAQIGGAVQGGTVAAGDAAQLDRGRGGRVDRLYRRDPQRAALAPDQPGDHPSPIDASDTETLLHLEMGWGARGMRHDWDGTLWPRRRRASRGRAALSRARDRLSARRPGQWPRHPPDRGRGAGCALRRHSRGEPQQHHPRHAGPDAARGPGPGRRDPCAALRTGHRDPRRAAFRGRQVGQSGAHRQPRLAVPSASPGRALAMAR